MRTEDKITLMENRYPSVKDAEKLDALYLSRYSGVFTLDEDDVEMYNEVFNTSHTYCSVCTPVNTKLEFDLAVLALYQILIIERDYDKAL